MSNDQTGADRNDEQPTADGKLNAQQLDVVHEMLKQQPAPKLFGYGVKR